MRASAFSEFELAIHAPPLAGELSNAKRETEGEVVNAAGNAPLRFAALSTSPLAGRNEDGWAAPHAPEGMLILSNPNKLGGRQVLRTRVRDRASSRER